MYRQSTESSPSTSSSNQEDQRTYRSALAALFLRIDQLKEDTSCKRSMEHLLTLVKFTPATQRFADQLAQNKRKKQAKSSSESETLIASSSRALHSEQVLIRLEKHKIAATCRGPITVFPIDYDNSEKNLVKLEWEEHPDELKGEFEPSESKEEIIQKRKATGSELKHGKKLSEVRKFVIAHGCIVCMLCSKRFLRQNRHLEDHCFSHADGAPFACSVCNKGFVAKRGAIKHAHFCFRRKSSPKENLKAKSGKKPSAKVSKDTARLKVIDRRATMDAELSDLVDRCFPFIRQPIVVLTRLAAT